MEAALRLLDRVKPSSELAPRRSTVGSSSASRTSSDVATVSITAGDSPIRRSSLARTGQAPASPCSARPASESERSAVRPIAHTALADPAICGWPKSPCPGGLVPFRSVVAGTTVVVLHHLLAIERNAHVNHNHKHCSAYWHLVGGSRALAGWVSGQAPWDRDRSWRVSRV